MAKLRGREATAPQGRPAPPSPPRRKLGPRTKAVYGVGCVVDGVSATVP